jgi:hypothetical protein
MSQSQKSLNSNGRRRMVALRTPGVAAANVPSARAGGRAAERVPPVWHRPEPSSGELFGREPFTYGRGPRYFGTGVPFYQSGPGFTGGYYGYGDEPPEIPTELEREYAHDLYGDEADAPAGTPTRRFPPAIQAMSGAFSTVRRLPKRARKYPPGPKGYQRSDERIREEICDELMQTDRIDSSEVTVEVTAAKVTLGGTAPERWMKHAIEDLADACPGVQDVDNRIRIKSAAKDA